MNAQLRSILELVKVTMMWNGNQPVFVERSAAVDHLVGRRLLLRQGDGVVLTRKGARLV